MIRENGSYNRDVIEDETGILNRKCLGLQDL